MRASALLFALVALLSVAGFGWLAAGYGVSVLERETKAQLSQALIAADQDWVQIEPDGLLIEFSGLAPDENARFKVLEIAGQLVDNRRVRDAMKIQATEQIVTPEFSLQILRNDDEVSLIGLIPLAHGRNVILPDLRKLGDALELTDMLETADYDVPDNWPVGVEYAMEAIRVLKRAHINVTDKTVTISGVTESVSARDTLSRDLTGKLPEGLTLDLDLSAPLPVVNPYRFNASLTDGTLTAAACSAGSVAARTRILASLGQSDAENPEDVCQLGLGAPSGNWAQVVSAGLTALGDLSGGTLDINDLDISLTAPKGTPPLTFAQTKQRLASALPDAYHLTAILPPADSDGSQTLQTLPHAFSLFLTEDGYAILKGAVRDAPQRKAVITYAASLFGADHVVDELALRSDVPEGWTGLLLDGLKGAELMHSGHLHITPQSISYQGRCNDPEKGQILSERLAHLITEDFEVRTDVTFDESLVEIENVLEPQNCATELDLILSETQITFDPSSAQIAEAAGIVVESIADVLKSCPEAAFEIGGHTDSQGSDTSNQALSQSRANAVLDALLDHQVLVDQFTAIGFGETQPIADNETEEGREENRRIEFRLLTKDNTRPIARSRNQSQSTQAAETDNEQN